MFLESKEFNMALSQFEKKHEAKWRAKREAKEAKKESIKHLIEFVDEELEYSLYGKMRASELYELYEGWASKKGIEKLGSNAFGEEIKKVLTHKRFAMGIHYMGVARK